MAKEEGERVAAFRAPSLSLLPELQCAHVGHAALTCVRVRPAGGRVLLSLGKEGVEIGGKQRRGGGMTFNKLNGMY